MTTEQGRLKTETEGLRDRCEGLRLRYVAFLSALPLPWEQGHAQKKQAEIVSSMLRSLTGIAEWYGQACGLGPEEWQLNADAVAAQNAVTGPGLDKAQGVIDEFEGER